MENTVDFAFTLPAPLVWGALTLFGVSVASWLVYISMPAERDTPDAVAQFKTRLGMEDVHTVPVLVVSVLWIGITLSLTLGLFGLIFEILSTPPASENLFYVLRIAGLTGVLGAVIALPLTIIRLRLTRTQTENATESLFNEKINAATQGLYARRQATMALAPGGSYRQHQDFWQDDIVQRCAAIDRLEGLADEAPKEVARIARLLSVYVRELSRDVHPAKAPDNATPEQLKEWAENLPALRSDMEKAAQTLGRLADIAPEPLVDGEIDLRGANLQRADLNGLKFERALFDGAQLQGAYLFRAQLQLAYLFRAQLQGAYLVRAQLQGANLGEAQLQEADLVEAQLQGANLRGAQLQGANLGRAQLQGANLRGAQLQGANLRGAELQEAYLFRAELQGANLGGAELQEANLVRAQLQGAYLFRAELQEANLVRAQLQGANLVRAQFDDATSLTAATLRGAAVREVDFTNVPQIAEHLADMFGDTTVKLPANAPELDNRWNTEIPWSDFYDKWRAWQATLPDGWDQPD